MATLGFIMRVYVKFRNLILYGVIGTCTATLDFLLFTALTLWADMYYIAANAVSCSLSILCSFLLNRKYNFRVTDHPVRRMVSFFSVGLAGLLLNSFVLHLCIVDLQWKNSVAKLTSIAITVIIQFLLNKFVTFRKPHPSDTMKKQAILILILSLVFVGGLLLQRYASRIRVINQLSRYDFPAENNGWTKYGEPLYGSKETKSVFDPFVYMEGDTFVMVASERKNNSVIRLESSDGFKWAGCQTLLEPIKGTWERLVNRATIVKRDSIYHMFYTGQSPDVSKIGHAWSTDGITYKRDTKNPVLVPTEPEEGISVMNPCVLYNERKDCFQMWYAAGENYEPDALFYAESKDGQSWTKHKEPVLTKYSAHEWEKAKVGGCDVKIVGDTYIMYYIGYQNEDVARICFATSQNGILWERPDSNLILAPTRGGWDSDATYKPSYMEVDGKAYLWYNGRNGRLERIGLATKSL